MKKALHTWSSNEVYERNLNKKFNTKSHPIGNMLSYSRTFIPQKQYNGFINQKKKNIL